MLVGLPVGVLAEMVCREETARTSVVGEIKKDRMCGLHAHTGSMSDAHDTIGQRGPPTVAAVLGLQAIITLENCSDVGRLISSEPTEFHHDEPAGRYDHSGMYVFAFGSRIGRRYTDYSIPGHGDQRSR